VPLLPVFVPVPVPVPVPGAAAQSAAVHAIHSFQFGTVSAHHKNSLVSAVQLNHAKVLAMKKEGFGWNEFEGFSGMEVFQARTNSQKYDKRLCKFVTTQMTIPFRWRAIMRWISVDSTVVEMDVGRLQSCPMLGIPRSFTWIDDVTWESVTC
jgi:hypothetical protein